MASQFEGSALIGPSFGLVASQARIAFGFAMPPKEYSQEKRIPVLYLEAAEKDFEHHICRTHHRKFNAAARAAFTTSCSPRRFTFVSLTGLTNKHRQTPAFSRSHKYAIRVVVYDLRRRHRKRLIPFILISILTSRLRFTLTCCCSPLSIPSNTSSLSVFPTNAQLPQVVCQFFRFPASIDANRSLITVDNKRNQVEAFSSNILIAIQQFLDRCQMNVY